MKVHSSLPDEMLLVCMLQTYKILPLKIAEKGDLPECMAENWKRILVSLNWPTNLIK